MQKTKEVSSRVIDRSMEHEIYSSSNNRHPRDAFMMLLDHLSTTGIMKKYSSGQAEI